MLTYDEYMEFEPIIKGRKTVDEFLEDMTIAEMQEFFEQMEDL